MFTEFPAKEGATPPRRLTSPRAPSWPLAELRPPSTPRARAVGSGLPVDPREHGLVTAGLSMPPTRALHLVPRAAVGHGPLE
eukprot:CAMPEP_0206022586 /NCGR_PEP_ID=MMETSP1464-20131121/34969_1 /ASSEMBLY_ACC=CAM_ASM_001124 /TAXON_ID=119497 /ORGANISM="Exanthemachrysis gayraliae, Strain RCC1523" /LENGTH=81 /DNA_ID=CAMNT_0053396555 /DNA_START=62 /DNA_END=304 /DNA_ORIENTATION=+